MTAETAMAVTSAARTDGRPGPLSSGVSILQPCLVFRSAVCFRPPYGLNPPLTISAPTIAPEDGRPPRPAGRQIEGAQNGSRPVFWQNLSDPRGDQAAGDFALDRHPLCRGIEFDIVSMPRTARATGPSPCGRSSPTPCGRRPISSPTSRKPTNWPPRPDSGPFRDDFPAF